MATDTNADGTTDFDKLLGELDTMAKAMPSGKAKKDCDGDEDDDAAAVAAAAAAGKKDDAAAGDGDKAADKGKLAKSFTIKLEDGTEVEAEDGTELVKALQTRLGEAEGRLTASEGLLAKAMQPVVTLMKAQGAAIADLAAKVAAMGNQGSGRKAVLTIVDNKSAAAVAELAKGGEKEGMEPHVFMTKAVDAMKSGRLTGSEVALAEACLNRGTAIPQNIVAKVVAA